MIIRRLARPMLSTIFISGGINAMRDAEGHAQAVKPWLDKTVGQQTANLPDSVPTEPVTLVRLDAGVKIGAGAMLALGKFPRLSSLALIGSLVPTTLANHAYWEFQDEGQKQAQQVQFLKNVSLAGGLLAVASDSGTKSGGRRAKKTADKGADKDADKGGKQAQSRNTSLSQRGGKKSRVAAEKAAKGKQAAKDAKKAAKKAGKR